jgi:hypothetical protein
MVAAEQNIVVVLFDGALSAAMAFYDLVDL